MDQARRFAPLGLVMGHDFPNIVGHLKIEADGRLGQRPGDPGQRRQDDGSGRGRPQDHEQARHPQILSRHPKFPWEPPNLTIV